LLVVPVATEDGLDAVDVPYAAVLVTLAPAMVVKFCTPPGGPTQMFWPAIKFVQ